MEKGSMDHDWRLFDEEAGWEVRRVSDIYEIRAQGKVGSVTMTPDEFDLWRQPKQEGMDT